MERPIVLVVTLSKNAFGGVVEFNNLLFKYSNVNIYSFRLKSGALKSKLFSAFLLIYDFIRFVFVLMFKSVDIVHINPSLVKNSLIRDGVFIRISKFFSKKVYVHWHGWDNKKESLLNKKYLKKTFFKADHIRFLSNRFLTKFIELGYKNTTSIGSTFFDDEILNYKFEPKNNNKKKTILFLSTISKNKGIYETIETFEILNTRFKNINLVIAGKGSEYENIKNLIVSKNLSNVKMIGFVEGVKKYEEYYNADIYIFPSYYEGMPTSILEAMAFGLPIVCSSVGAIPEIFNDKKSGFIINSLNTRVFANKIELLLKNNNLRKKISEYNFEYAKKNFIASKIINDIDIEYKKLYENK